MKNDLRVFQLSEMFYLLHTHVRASIKISINIATYTLKNQRLKKTQLEKARFIKVNELKVYKIELF